MKKYAGLFLMMILLNVTTVLAGVEISSANFPNAAFRSLVSEFDLDKDGFLIPDEFEAVKEIDCNKNTKITNLKGVEIFTNLTSLSCLQCPIGKLDVSKNIKLEYLDCCECKLSALDVTANPNIKQLWCYGNSIKTLDLHNCKYLVKAANKGVYNNDKNDGKACSYADKDNSAYLVVDKNIIL
ncbi:MAG: hypothetical protein Q4G47_08600, partial [Lachnospiraceae bacterium]|nr:hypothetical protein [Lachnospiraceae bacterium]